MIGITIESKNYFLLVLITLFNVSLNLAFWMVLMWWAAKLIGKFFGIDI